ncbi:uncharacterized protein LOC129944034 [Eupeodes corollae]|uniref:uncharacterized protein LOC129944034 n=1 Tax=Eupeodes corollae TaxID=290404 RepID=UPI00248FDD53|nr:uncharacterized protein LOC129944034 [Eupeodes corollae]
MALSRNTLSEIPKDAVELSPEEAVMYQWKIIGNWEKSSEVWALNYAPEILGVCGTFTGIYMNNYFRGKLKLGQYGKLSTYLPIVVLPAITTLIYHKFFIQKELLLEPFQCPTCLQLRAAAFQTCLGVIYPSLLAPIASFMFATRHYTFRLPSVTEKPMEVVALLRKMTKPIVPTIGAVISFHALLAMYITFKETQQYINVQKKMVQLEADIIANNEIEL